MAEKNGSFEMDLDELRRIVDKLSEGGTTIDEMMQLYEKGSSLYEKCRKTLESYEAKLELIDKKRSEVPDAE